MTNNATAPLGPRRSVAERLQLVKLAEDVAIATFEHVCIVIWRDRITEPYYEQIRQILEVALHKYPQVGFLAVVEERSSPPDAAVRDMMVKKLVAFEHAPLSIACAIEGTGFRGAIARSAGAALRMLFGRKPPTSFCADVKSAAEWIARHSPVYVDELCEATEALRDLLNRHQQTKVSVGRPASPLMGALPTSRI